MKLLATSLVSLVFATAAYGDSINLAIPSAPPNYQSDKFRSGDNDCSNAIGSATNLELGVTGLIQKTDPFGNTNQAGDVGVYARVVIPLGAKPRSRIDCNRLFELEMRRQELEIMKLERELQELTRLRYVGE